MFSSFFNYIVQFSVIYIDSEQVEIDIGLGLSTL